MSTNPPTEVPRPPTVIIFPNDINGVLEVGVAAGADEVKDSKFFLTIVVGSDSRETAIKTLVSNTNPGVTASEKKLWQGMVAFICHNGYFCRSSKSHTVTGTEPVAVTTAEEINDIGFWPPQECVNLIAALKITWWLTNHHVGQDKDKLVSYVGKVAHLQGIWDGIHCSETARSILWSCGKWVSTTGFLKAIGVSGVKVSTGEDRPFTDIPAIATSEDVLLRIEAYPAGTAKCSTYFAIARKAASTMYAVCLPSLNSYFKISKCCGEILDAPAEYHMGAYFLTGKDQAICEEWEEEEKIALSAFVHAAMPGSTLARAAVILPMKEISGSIYYSRITALKTASLVAKSDDELLAAASAYVGTQIGNTLAEQMAQYAAENAQ